MSGKKQQQLLLQQQEQARHKSVFDDDNLAFCSECGTLMPVPGDKPNVVCPRCGAQRSVERELVYAVCVCVCVCVCLSV
jgi:rubrerythrin